MTLTEQQERNALGAIGAADFSPFQAPKEPEKKPAEINAVSEGERQYNAISTGQNMFPTAEETLAAVESVPGVKEGMERSYKALHTETLTLEYPALAEEINQRLADGWDKDKLRKALAETESYYSAFHTQEEIDKMLGRTDETKLAYWEAMDRQKDDAYVRIMHRDMSEDRVRHILHTAKLNGLTMPGRLLMAPKEVLQEAEKKAGERYNIFMTYMGAFLNAITGAVLDSGPAQRTAARARMAAKDDNMAAQMGAQLLAQNEAGQWMPQEFAELTDEERTKLGRKALATGAENWSGWAKNWLDKGAQWAHMNIRPPEGALGAFVFNAIENSGFTLLSAVRSGLGWAAGGPIGGLIMSGYNTWSESESEAGNTFIAAKQKGWSDEDAWKASTEVFGRNLAFLPISNFGGDLLLHGAGKMFEKLAGTVTGTGWGQRFMRGLITRGLPVVGEAVPEGFEELAQDYFQMDALKEPIDSGRLWEAFRSGMAQAVLYSLAGVGTRKAASWAFGKTPMGKARAEMRRIEAEAVEGAVLGAKLARGEIKPDEIVGQDPVVFVPRDALSEEARQELGIEPETMEAEEGAEAPAAAVAETPAETDATPTEEGEEDTTPNEIAIRKSVWDEWAAKHTEEADALKDRLREGTKGVTAIEALDRRMDSILKKANESPEFHSAEADEVRDRLTKEFTAGGRPEELAKVEADTALRFAVVLKMRNPNVKMSLNDFTNFTIKSLGNSIDEVAAEKYEQSMSHGTRHNLGGRFDLTKIGTGEGSMAFAWGSYLAENRGVSESYRKAGGDKYDITRVTFTNANGDNYQSNGANSAVARFLKELAIKELDRSYGRPTPSLEENVKRYIEKQRQQLEQLKDEFEKNVDAGAEENEIAFMREEIADAENELAEMEANAPVSATVAPGDPGNLYTVEGPENEDLLDWDAPISEQPEKVKKAINEIISNLEVDEEVRNELKDIVRLDMEGEIFYNKLSRILEAKEYSRLAESTDFLHNSETIKSGKQLASELLNKHNIPGTRYWDQFSRDAKTGTHNFVIWNTDLLKIMGVEGPAAETESYGQARAAEAIENDIDGTLTDKKWGLPKGYVVEGADNPNNLKGAKQYQFVLRNGDKNWGYITEKLTKGNPDLKVGPIRVKVGNRGYGLKHVKSEHMKDVLQYKSNAEEFISNIIDNGNEIIPLENDKKGRISEFLVVMKPNAERQDAAILVWEEKDGGYYFVKSAYSPKTDYLDRQKSPSLGSPLPTPTSASAPLASDTADTSLRSDGRTHYGDSDIEDNIPQSNETVNNSQTTQRSGETVNATTTGWVHGQAGQEAWNVPSIIKFFETANASTGFHELGHHMLRVMMDVSKLEGASDQLKADVNTILKHAGVTMEEFDNDLKKRIQAHEFFARSWEVYLGTGKAPTPELQGVFFRLHQWFKEVYHNVVEALGIKLSPEMQDVFDRILATPDQTEMAEYERNTSVGELTAETDSIQQRVKELEGEIRQEEAKRDEGMENFAQSMFHGTRHNLNGGFDLTKIGTGEGAQVYGYGMYLAENRDVSESYRTAGETPLTINFVAFTLPGGDVATHWNFQEAVNVNPNVPDTAPDFIRYLAEKEIERAMGKEVPSLQENAQQYLKKLEGVETQENIEKLKKLTPVSAKTPEYNPGNLYSVEGPENYDLLDWDAPLSEQPENVKKALQPIIDEYVNTDGEKGIPINPHTTGQQIQKEIALGLRRGELEVGGKNLKGKDISANSKEVSLWLNEHGIPGLRYLDQGSRDAKTGTHNFVIWNTDLLKIMGVEGPAAEVERYDQSQPKAALAEMDKRYMAAVEAGDMETAQKIVDARARDMGYISDDEYRMNHRAPNSHDEDTSVTMADARQSDIVPADYWTTPRYYQHYGDEYASFYKIIEAIDKNDRYKAEGKGPARIWMYRAVPKGVKEDSFRNGDWITPSREYAQSEGAGIPGGYRIIAQRVDIDKVWWDANSINEWGYDDGKNYTYKNTKNNRKLTDAVVRDADGNIVPPSKRFNSRKMETFYQTTFSAPAQMTEAEIDEMTRDQIDAVQKQYEGTDQYMKSPNGKDTNLTEKQWLQVRTPAFKEWFGDWEAAHNVQAVKDFLESSAPVGEISGTEFQKSDTPLTDRVEKYYKDTGNTVVHNKELGDVTLDRRGIKDSSGHGLGKEKAAAFALVPDVIKNGLVYAREQKWKGRGYDTATLIANVKIGGKDYVCEVIVKKSNNRQGFYLHEVEVKENLDSVFKTALNDGTPSGSRLIISQYARDANNASKVVDENGEPLVVYRGTPEKMGSIFEYGKSFYGGNKGFWFTTAKTAAKDYAFDDVTGNYGEIKDVYLNMRNVLDLTPLKLRCTSKQFCDYIRDNFGLDLGRGSKKEYRTHELYEKYQNELYSLAGYDGIKLCDVGITYIAKLPEQIKSATDNRGTFDAGNMDIYHQDDAAIDTTDYTRANEDNARANEGASAVDTWLYDMEDYNNKVTARQYVDTVTKAIRANGGLRLEDFVHELGEELATELRKKWPGLFRNTTQGPQLELDVLTETLKANGIDFDVQELVDWLQNTLNETPERPVPPAVTPETLDAMMWKAGPEGVSNLIAERKRWLEGQAKQEQAPATAELRLIDQILAGDKTSERATYYRDWIKRLRSEKNARIDAEIKKRQETVKALKAGVKKKAALRREVDRMVRQIKRAVRDENVIYHTQQEIQKLYEEAAPQSKSIKDVKIAALRELHEKIITLQAEGRRELELKKLLDTERINRARDDLMSPMLKRLAAVRAGRGPSAKAGREDTGKLYVGLKGKAQQFWDSVMANTMGTNRFFDWLDGANGTFDGAWVRWFVDRGNEATNAELQHLTERRLWIENKAAELKINIRDLAKTRDVGVPKGKVGNGRWTVNELMSIYAGMKNENSRAAILYGNFGEFGEDAEAMVAKCVEGLTDEERAFADAIIEEYEINFDRVNDALIDVYNRGMTHEKNYTPIRRLEYSTKDGMMSPDAADVLMGAQAQAGGLMSVEKGFTKSRMEINAENQSAIDLGLFSIWNSQVEVQEHAAAFGGLVRDMRRILMGRTKEQPMSVQKLVKQVHGDAAWKNVKNYFNIMARDNRQVADDVLNKSANWMARNMSRVYLCANLGTATKQFSSFPRFLPYSGLGHLLSAIGQFTARRSEFLKEVYALDPQLAQRQGNLLLNEMKEAEGGPYEKLINIGMAPIGWVDRAASAIGWKAVYDANIAKGLSKEDAIKAAQRAVLLTQPTTQRKDAPRLWQQGGLLRLAMMFTNDCAQTFGINAYDMAAAIRRGDVPRVLYTLAGVTLAAGLMRLLTYGMPDDDDDESWLEWGLAAVGRQSVEVIPILGKGLVHLWDTKGYDTGETSPYLAPFAKLMSGANGLWDDKEANDERAWWNLFEGASLLGGFPAVALHRLRRVGQDVADGDTIKALQHMIGQRVKEKKAQKALRL